MNDKTVRARNALRETVDEGYSHIKHLMLNSLITLVPTLVFAMIAFFAGISLWSLTAIPLAILFGNFIEYATHRWPMHKPKAPGGKYLFKRHAGEHHRAFEVEFMEITDPRDYSLVMLPPLRAAVFMSVLIAIAGVAGLTVGAAFGALIGMTLGLYFFIGEALHISFHFKSTWENDKWYNRFLRRIGRWHRIHHELKLMSKYNFNIAFPIFDKVLGTLIDEDDDVVILKRDKAFTS